MKSILQSKTFWIAVVQAFAGIVAAAVSVDPHLQTLGGLVVLKSILDIALRCSTTKPIGSI